MSKKYLVIAVLTTLFIAGIACYFSFPHTTANKSNTVASAPAKKLATKREPIDPEKPTQPKTKLKQGSHKTAPKQVQKALTKLKAFATVRGKVFVPDGSTMAQARIYCNPFTRNENNTISLDYNESQRVKSDINGDFSLTLKPGQYCLRAGTRGPYRSTKRYYIDVHAGDEKIVDLELRVYLTLTIAVRDEQGKPIQGVELWLQPEDMPGSLRGPELTSDANGLVLFKRLSDERHNVLISHPKFAQRAIKIELKEGVVHSERSYILVKGLTLTGVLLSSKTKKPLLNASMTLQKLSDSIFHTRFDCDPDAIFTFPSLSPGRYELTGRAEGFANKTVTINVPKGSRDINLGKISLDPLLDLTVTVIDGEGKILPGVAVRLLDYGPCPYSVIKDAAEDGIDSLFFFKVLDRDLSDAKGQVHFKEFIPGTHNFVLTKKGSPRNYCDAQVVSDSNRQLTIQLRSDAGSIKGQFYDKNGQTQKGKVMALLREGYTAIIEGKKTGEDGRFEFSALAPGRYKVLEVSSTTKEDLLSPDNWLTLEQGEVLVQNVLE